MSRGYRIRIPQRHATAKASASGTIELTIDMLPILDPDVMAQLLTEQLIADGWERTRTRALTRKVDGISVQLNPKQGTISGKAHTEAEFVGRGSDLEMAQSSADAAANRAQHVLNREVNQTLARAEAAVHAEVQSSIQAVYVQALKRKAASMGRITSIDESQDGDTLDLTIKIEI